MKHLSFFSILILIVIFGTFSNSLSSQTAVGYGPRAKSMAGAGTALVENSLWGNVNPGALVFLGNKYGVGIEFILPKASYEVIGSATEFEPTVSSMWPLGLQAGLVNADKKTNIMPHLGFNLALDKENAMALSIYGNSNRGYSYETKTYYSPVIAGFGSGEGFINPMGTVTSPTFLKLNQYFAALSYSRKIGDKLGIGLSVVGSWQSLSVGGLEAFGSLRYSTDPQNLTNNGVSNAYGVGGKLGVQWNVSEAFQLGVGFRSKIYMSKFDAYSGLISESGKMDMPSEWNIGLVYHPFEKFLMAFDVNRYCYSGVPAWGMAMRQEGTVELGGENGSGFGRKDQMSYKLGLQYKIPKWQFRMGYAHTDQPVVASEMLLNILMPEITEDFVSVGFSRNLGKQNINFALVRGFNNSLLGYNELDSNQEIEIKTESWMVEISIEF